MLDEVDDAIGADTDEGVQLRVLLLWLAWDIGEELTEQIGRIWDDTELKARHDRMQFGATVCLRAVYDLFGEFVLLWMGVRFMCLWPPLMSCVIR